MGVVSFQCRGRVNAQDSVQLGSLKAEVLGATALSGHRIATGRGLSHRTRGSDSTTHRVWSFERLRRYGCVSLQNS